MICHWAIKTLHHITMFSTGTFTQLPDHVSSGHVFATYLALMSQQKSEGLTLLRITLYVEVFPIFLVQYLVYLQWVCFNHFLSFLFQITLFIRSFRLSWILLYHEVCQAFAFSVATSPVWCAQPPTLICALRQSPAFSGDVCLGKLGLEVC